MNRALRLARSRRRELPGILSESRNTNVTIDPRKAAEELQTAEALSRRDEAVANIHRSRGIKSEFVDRDNNSGREQEERERLKLAASAKDYEGTVANVADAAGNLPKDAAQSAAGGTGVAASNSGPEDQDKRVQSSQASPAAANAQSQAAPTPEGDSSSIPENWKDLSWPERQALAKSLAKPGETVKNGDDADRIIEAASKKA